MSLLKGLEDTLLIFWCNAGSRIGHPHGEIPIRHPYLKFNLTRFGIGNCIAHQIEEHLRQTAFVPQANRQIGRGGHRQLHVFLVSLVL